MGRPSGTSALFRPDPNIGAIGRSHQHGVFENILVRGLEASAIKSSKRLTLLEADLGNPIWARYGISKESCKAKDRLSIGRLAFPIFAARLTCLYTKKNSMETGHVFQQRDEIKNHPVRLFNKTRQRTKVMT